MAFPSKNFYLNLFFWGIDCRTMIGWIFFIIFKKILFLFFFEQINWVECWHFLAKFSALIFFLEILIVKVVTGWIYLFIYLFILCDRPWWSYLLKWRKWKIYKHKNKGKYEDKRILNPKPVVFFFLVNLNFQVKSQYLH